MIPGLQSKLSEEVVASATSISVRTDLVIVTGTTAIATISPPRQGGAGTILILVPISGAVSTTTAGNIGKVVAMVQFQSCTFVWSKSQQKWYPGPIS
jgi:predicted phosphoribosyltransferase